jgi:hypothetical protein
MSTEERIIRAIEAIEDGDFDYAIALLSGCVEQPRMRYRCECGYTAEWPGLLMRHRDLSGHGLDEELEAA